MPVRGDRVGEEDEDRRDDREQDPQHRGAPPVVPAHAQAGEQLAAGPGRPVRRVRPVVVVLAMTHRAKATAATTHPSDSASSPASAVTGGEGHCPQRDEVGGQQPQHGGLRAAEGGAEEDVEDPDEHQDHGAVDGVRNKSPHDRPEAEVDDREHGCAGGYPPRVVQLSSGGQGEHRDQGRQQGQHGAGRQPGGRQPDPRQPGQREPTVGGAGGGDLEVHRDRGQEGGRPSRGDGLDGGTASGAAQQPGGVGHRRGCDHDEDNGYDGEQDQVRAVPGVVGQEASDQECVRGHRGHVLPSRISTIRSNRASSTTKWLTIRTVRPAARRSSTRSQNFR